MASLIKIQVTRPIPKSAVVVEKNGTAHCRFKRRGRTITLPLTRDGQRYRDESGKWYVQYKDENDRWQREPAYRDKESSLQLAAKLERRVERRKSGIVDAADEHVRCSLEKHLDQFASHLRAKENSPDHVAMSISRIRKVCDACGFVRTIDIDAEPVEQFLAEQRDEGMSRTTSNHYLTAIKSFCCWMVPKRLPSNPLAALSRLNTEVDLRRVRRSLEPNQFLAIIDAASSGKTTHRITAQNRMWLYTVASHTGLRAQELASLTASSFDLAHDDPTVTVTAGYSKRRRKDLQPLRQDVASLLREWLQSKPMNELLWPGKWYRRAAEMLRVDLAEAGIPYEDEAGHVFDFHAIRHFYITELVRSGVYPKLAQSLARHSTITLTMDRYAHVEASECRQALFGLPKISASQAVAKDSRIQGPEKSVAQMVAQTSDVTCPSPSHHGTEAHRKGGDDNSAQSADESQVGTHCRHLTSSRGGIRTRTRVTPHRILSPGRLPIPPLGLTGHSNSLR